MKTPLARAPLFFHLMAAAAACSPLSAHVCAETCIPFDAGTPAQSDFSCGDWWVNAHCCNGTDQQKLVTSVFYDCFCQTTSMTRRGLAVILLLVIATCAAIFGAVFYVLHRKKQRLVAEEAERDKAIEEAQEYLPR